MVFSVSFCHVFFQKANKLNKIKFAKDLGLELGFMQPPHTDFYSHSLMIRKKIHLQITSKIQLAGKDYFFRLITDW